MTENTDRPANDLVDISSDELDRVTELLTVLDEFLRSDGTAGLLAAYLRTTGCSHPGYDAALLIDQVSFTAHALRGHRGAAESRRRGIPAADACDDIDHLR